MAWRSPALPPAVASCDHGSSAPSDRELELGMLDAQVIGARCSLSDSFSSADMAPLEAMLALKSGAKFSVFEASDSQCEMARKPVRSSCSTVACAMLQCFIKVAGIGFMVVILILAALHWPESLREDPSARAQVMSALFAVGLLLVALEDVIHINKSAMMLFLATTMWTLLAMAADTAKEQDELHLELSRGLEDVGAVILFLLPAMAVVETIDHFDGFALVTHLICQSISGGRVMRLLPIVCMFTFFLSSIIDNLTATIVALKILRLVDVTVEYRHLCGGLVVIAANAGGAWSPIGDVTTTMLWIQGKISAVEIVKSLFMPSLVAGVAPMLGIWWQARRTLLQSQWSRCRDSESEEEGTEVSDGAGCDDSSPVGRDGPTGSKTVALCLGIACILMVPLLKMLTGLPPFLGMLLALGTMWLLADSVLRLDTKGLAEGPTGVAAALHKVDLSGLLFFTGVLLSVGCLNSAGVLHRYADWLVSMVGHNYPVLCTLLGVSSAVVDNVPLVEAAIDMFEEVPLDSPLWQLTALAGGTGGSILSIGSVAGVTFMSMEQVSFMWYFRRIGVWAAFGYSLAIAAYVVQRQISWGDM